ncbi:MAG: putative membrane protein YeaQ/YmgE (transglycosylase-associated protein family) [Granulosicoccus sp.]|jgi:uncharacterized membrane protein YeaQ/YmgE (transglycosylase-associated protein family)
MRAFETVRTIYLVLYALIWAIAVLAILGTLAAVLTDSLEGMPLPTVIGAVGAVVISAMVLSWLILITICTIDSRNFLADMRQQQLDAQGQNTAPERHRGDRFDRPI